MPPRFRPVLRSVGAGAGTGACSGSGSGSGSAGAAAGGRAICAQLIAPFAAGFASPGGAFAGVSFATAPCGAPCGALPVVLNACAVVVTGGRGEYRGVASFQQVMEHIRQVQEQAAARSERVDDEADASSTAVANTSSTTDFDAQADEGEQR